MSPYPILLLLLLTGCNALSTTPVAGWPALRVIEHYVPHAEMRSRCSPYVGFGTPEACAEFIFYAASQHQPKNVTSEVEVPAAGDAASEPAVAAPQGECHIWYSAEFPPSRVIIEHERAHCAGYDHAGSKNMAGLVK